MTAFLNASYNTHYTAKGRVGTVYFDAMNNGKIILHYFLNTFVLLRDGGTAYLEFMENNKY